MAEEGAKGGGGAGPMKIIRAEIEKMDKKWSGQLKIKKGPKGTPFPVEVLRIIPQPEAAAAWDHTELKIKLIIGGKDMSEMPIDVDVLQPTGGLPIEHCELIRAKVLSKWQKKLKSQAKDAEEGQDLTWQMLEVFKYCEKNFVDLLRLAAKVEIASIDYYGEGADRRFRIEWDREAEKEVDEEEEEKRRQEEIEGNIFYMRQKMEAAKLAEDEKMRLGEIRRKQAEDGIFEDGAPAVKLSKKEQEAAYNARKHKQGVRTAKTGPKSRKASDNPDNAGKTQ